MASLEYSYLGSQIPYALGLSLMESAQKDLRANPQGPFRLFLLQHRPVITTTKLHGDKNLLLSRKALSERGIEVCLADRGGDATFHGPGQLVGYPVFVLKPLLAQSPSHEVDLVGYVRALEKALLHGMHRLGLKDACLIPKLTGVWVPDAHSSVVRLRKLIAIGVGVSHGISRHGFALNMDIQLEDYLSCLVPCGLRDYGVTTLKKALEDRGQSVPGVSEISETLAQEIGRAFSLDLLVPKPRPSCSAVEFANCML